jgi:dienelactone hydrolase
MADHSPTTLAARPVVYTMAGVSDVTRDTLSYLSSAGTSLPFDVYRPPGGAHGPPWPAVVLVTGYGDAGMRRVFGCSAREMGAFTSWARLLAASGMAAVAYENEQPALDARAAFDHVRTAGASLGLDATRIGVWSCSGHAPMALAMLMNEPDITCTTLLYPYLLDIGGHTEVEDAAATFRFVTPAAGRTPGDLPERCPLLIARAGGDTMPGLNDSLDRFAAAALAANRPVTVVNHPPAPHAFDLTDDTRESHRVIQGVLQFLATHLDA